MRQWGEWLLIILASCFAPSASAQQWRTIYLDCWNTDVCEDNIHFPEPNCTPSGGDGSGVSGWGSSCPNGSCVDPFMRNDQFFHGQCGQGGCSFDDPIPSGYQLDWIAVHWYGMAANENMGYFQDGLIALNGNWDFFTVEGDWCWATDGSGGCKHASAAFMGRALNYNRNGLNCISIRSLDQHWMWTSYVRLTLYVSEAPEEPEEQPDTDGDTVPDAQDNCRTADNSNQADADSDGVGNECDNCPALANATQANYDGDRRGDACDNCEFDWNWDQSDGDLDTVGTVCDNCPFEYNADQLDSDDDDWGDVCDNCADVSNSSQGNSDSDEIGDFCDNCDEIANPNQEDTNDDGEGDACDGDIDGDGVIDEEDNCPTVSNEDQLDSDNDGFGDVCEFVLQADQVLFDFTSLGDQDSYSMANNSGQPLDQNIRLTGPTNLVGYGVYRTSSSTQIGGDGRRDPRERFWGDGYPTCHMAVRFRTTTPTTNDQEIRIRGKIMSSTGAQIGEIPWFRAVMHDGVIDSVLARFTPRSSVRRDLNATIEWQHSTLTGSSWADDLPTSNVNLYWILQRPSSPQYPRVWKGVLDHATTWAQGTNTVDLACIEVGKGIYEYGFHYARGGPWHDSPHYAQPEPPSGLQENYLWGSFTLSQLLADMDPTHWPLQVDRRVMCDDTAEMMANFANSLGAYLTIAVLQCPHQLPKLYTNALQEIGIPECSNDVFWDPPPDTDVDGFSYHKWARQFPDVGTNQSLTYDPCVKWGAWVGQPCSAGTLWMLGVTQEDYLARTFKIPAGNPSECSVRRPSVRTCQFLN